MPTLQTQQQQHLQQRPLLEAKTYLVHGFRWPRPLIRIHIILQNLEEARSEWIISPETSHLLINSLHSLHPKSMVHLPTLRFIEQYDTNDGASSASTVTAASANGGTPTNTNTSTHTNTNTNTSINTNSNMMTTSSLMNTNTNTTAPPMTSGNANNTNETNNANNTTDSAPMSHSLPLQPFAYVCDIVHEVNLGVEVDEVRSRGISNEAWGAMIDLRDKIAPGEKVAWFVVHCGDIERHVPSPTMKIDADARDKHDGNVSIADSKNGRRSNGHGDEDGPKKKRFPFAKLFGTRKSTNNNTAASTTASPPYDRSLRKSQSTKQLATIAAVSAIAPPLPNNGKLSNFNHARLGSTSSAHANGNPKHR